MQVIFATLALTVLAICVYSQGELPEPGICGVSAIKPKPDSRIINGEPVFPHSRPYQLLLVGYFPNGTTRYYCGASLITSRHVLTASHCVVGNVATDIRLHVGLHNFTSSVLNAANGIPAQKYISHPSYSNRTLANDVAVVRLQVPVQVDNIKVGLICLPTSSSEQCKSGTRVVASGWGALTGNRSVSSRPTQLQQVVLQCVDGNNNPDCKRLTYTLGFIQDKTKLCAYGVYKGVCFGDSGGPLVRERTHSDGRVYLEQVGIMSGTVDCSLSKPYPDIYADVWYFRAWIAQQVKALP